MNSIDAKGYNFLQQNMPGNDGYGQKGIMGDTGGDGNSVYFTPYILTNEADSSACRDLILKGKELSNNPLYVNKHVEYKVNDIILDKLGNVYILKDKGDNSDLENFPFIIFFLSNIFERGSVTGNSLQCTVNYSENPESDYYYKKKYNDDFIGAYTNKTGSPFIYHRDRYVSRLCGSWVTFNIPTIEQEFHDYLYKFVFVFPNGQKLEKQTHASSCEIFLDNRYFYSCGLSDPDNQNGKVAALRTYANYHSNASTGEYDIYFTAALLAIFIEKCMAYVEITNKETNDVYRIYADSIRLAPVDNGTDLENVMSRL